MQTKTNNNPPSVSVVIATLGGDCLENTIYSLNSGSLIPDEILVCIPEQYIHRVENLSYPNLQVIEIDSSGQVYQRAVGLRMVKTDMTLQLDDDVIFESDTLKKLVEKLKTLGPGNAVSPIFYNSSGDACLHEHKGGLTGFVNNLYHFLFCGAHWGIKRMGTVTKVGLNYGVDDKYLKVSLYETQWLPGGCVISFSNDLIKHNFYPFAGKAYSEDLIHSFLRSQKGIRQWVTSCARCFTDVFPTETKSEYESVDKARYYFLDLIAGSKLRFKIFLIMSNIKRFVSTACIAKD